QGLPGRSRLGRVGGKRPGKRSRRKRLPPGRRPRPRCRAQSRWLDRAAGPVPATRSATASATWSLRKRGRKYFSVEILKKTCVPLGNASPFSLLWFRLLSHSQQLPKRAALARQLLLLDHLAIAQPQQAIRLSGVAGIVGDQQDRLAVIIHQP